MSHCFTRDRNRTTTPKADDTISVINKIITKASPRQATTKLSILKQKAKRLMIKVDGDCQTYEFKRIYKEIYVCIYVHTYMGSPIVGAIA